MEDRPVLRWVVEFELRPFVWVESGHRHRLLECRAVRAVGLAVDNPRVQELEDFEDQLAHVGQPLAGYSRA
jgi:hypothetical protein